MNYGQKELQKAINKIRLNKTRAPEAERSADRSRSRRRIPGAF